VKASELTDVVHILGNLQTTFLLVKNHLGMVYYRVSWGLISMIGIS
jgi:hypothetical protein